MKSLLSSRPVLWFLFLFNAAVAVAVAVGGHRGKVCIWVLGYKLEALEALMGSLEFCYPDCG